MYQPLRGLRGILAFSRTHIGGYLLSDPGVEVRSSRTRSIATTIYGRLRELSVDGSVWVDSPDRSFLYGYVIRWSSLGITGPSNRFDALRSSSLCKVFE